MNLNELPCPNCVKGVTVLALPGPYGGAQPIAFRCPCAQGDRRTDLTEIPEAIKRQLLEKESLPKEKPLTKWQRFTKWLKLWLLGVG